MPRRDIIRAGKLRHSIQIVNPSTQIDQFGGPVTADATVFATTRASIEAISGRELHQAQQIVAEVTHLVTIRWMPGVKAKMNVWFAESFGSPAQTVTRQFQIMHVDNPDEQHRVLLLYCIERDDSAYQGPGQ